MHSFPDFCPIVPKGFLTLLRSSMYRFARSEGDFFYQLHRQASDMCGDSLPVASADGSLSRGLLEHQPLLESLLDSLNMRGALSQSQQIVDKHTCAAVAASSTHRGVLALAGVKLSKSRSTICC